ncbi:hypothetical protein ABZ054_20065, partial [Streptomyces sp. NPDC006324]
MTHSLSPGIRDRWRPGAGALLRTGRRTLYLLTALVTLLSCGFLAVGFLLRDADADARSTALVPLPVVLPLLTVMGPVCSRTMVAVTGWKSKVRKVEVKGHL